jgi:hypothetical protein
LLRQIMVAQRATFVNRYAAQLQAYGGDHALVRMGKDNVSLEVVKYENTFFRLYLQTKWSLRRSSLSSVSI